MHTYSRTQFSIRNGEYIRFISIGDGYAYREHWINNCWITDYSLIPNILWTTDI